MNHVPIFAREWRVKRLIKQATARNLFPHSDKREAVRKLLLWHADARRIQFAAGCSLRGCKSKIFLSFQLPDDVTTESGQWESCGYFCPRCGFSNAGARRTKVKHLER